MMRRAPVRVLLASTMLVACGESGWREDREPVTELTPGGAIGDPAQELRFEEDPRRLIYSPAVDLELTAADTAGAADADTTQADTTAADTTASPPEPDTTRMRTKPDPTSG